MRNRAAYEGQYMSVTDTVERLLVLKSRRTRLHTRLIATASTLTLAAAGLLIASPPASAASETVTSGSLQWGVKSSFRAYLSTPGAAGGVTASGGATDNGSVTTFPVNASGSVVDTAAGSADIKYSGSVRFYGHAATVGGTDYQLDLNLTNVNVVVSGTTGTVFADSR